MKWLHNLLKGISLTGALFVFQACYGTPMPPLYEDSGEAPMSFSVVSHATGLPIQGVKVQGKAYSNGVLQDLGVTDAHGKCHVEIPYVRNLPGPYITFQGPGDTFVAKDTTLADLRERDILIKLVELL